MDEKSCWEHCCEVESITAMLLPVALYESPRLSDFYTMYALHLRTSVIGKRRLSLAHDSGHACN